MEKLFVALILLLVGATACAAAKSEFLISHWCGPTEFTQERINEAAEAGFNVIMIDHGTVAEKQKALDLCKAAGVKGMVTDERMLTKGAYSKGFAENLDSVITDYGSHPALWGYFLTDEPNSDRFIRLKEVNEYLLKKDPKHIPFVNLFPNYANAQQLGNPVYEQHVDEYCRVVRPKLISYDHYALFENGERAEYFDNMEVVRRQGIKHNTPFSYILLSLPHGPYRDPSDADLRWQVNTALAYGARGIMYFTYTTPPPDANWKWHDGIIDENGKRNRKYNEVKQINAEVKKLAPTLMGLTSVAVYHTGTLPKGTKALPEGGLIGKVNGGEFVIGQFNSDSGDKYAMFVNRSLKNSENASITFSQKVKIFEVSRASGRERVIMVSDEGAGNIWHTRFAPGEGKLVRIEQAENLPVMHWEDKPNFRPRVMLNPSNQFANQIFDKDTKTELYNEGMNMYLIAEKVKSELDAHGGIDVFISRGAQTQRTTLGYETSLAKSLNCDLLFALHSDATGSSDPGGGTWTFYSEDEGQKLGKDVQSSLTEAIKTFYPKIWDRGVKTHWVRLWVLHEAGAPAALTEFLFHTNPTEREMLKDPKCQETMAKAVAKGILEYFGMAD